MREGWRNGGGGGMREGQDGGGGEGGGISAINYAVSNDEIQVRKNFRSAFIVFIEEAG